MAAHKRRCRRGACAIITAIVMITTGAAILIHIHDYRTHARDTAARLIQMVRADSRTTATAPCTAPPPSSPSYGAHPRLILTIPSLGVVAPVLRGLGNGTLNVAVGHLDDSSWPDQIGRTVLEAHDVTFFSQLSKTRPGDTITLTGRCAHWTYRVTGGEIVHAGTPIFKTTDQTLSLITCYPTNALYYTDRRFVLDARLLTHQTAPNALATPPTGSPLSPAIPPALAAVGLSVDSIDLPLGTLSYDPTLSKSWQQSPLPLQASDTATHLLVAAWKAAHDDRADWWHAIAPAVPLATALETIRAFTAWNAATDVTIHGTDNTVTGATLSAHINTRNAGGDHSLTIEIGVDPQHHATITNWTFSAR